MQNSNLTNNLELIIGPVCSGKSAELIRRIDRYTIAGYSVLLAKPEVDTRSIYVESRNGSKMTSLSLKKASDIFDYILDISLDIDKPLDIIAFDEAQFFPELYDSVKELLNYKYKVMISALDSDFNGDPFGDITKLVTLSDSVIKMTSVCMSCRNDNAIFSQKLKKGGSQIEIGNLELYEPRCLNCFIPGGLDES